MNIQYGKSASNNVKIHAWSALDIDKLTMPPAGLNLNYVEILRKKP